MARERVSYKRSNDPSWWIDEASIRLIEQASVEKKPLLIFEEENGLVTEYNLLIDMNGLTSYLESQKASEEQARRKYDLKRGGKPPKRGDRSFCWPLSRYPTPSGFDPVVTPSVFKQPYRLGVNLDQDTLTSQHEMISILRSMDQSLKTIIGKMDTLQSLFEKRNDPQNQRSTL